ncbi:CvpA family protein [Candidatus Tisiphia endosymbiont of Nemotelus uliginosus]|uniref:CvpA family protein n=1 Tax=Candidatus Tisiphia endosymbiont of Nemotelus uliginosus TaxID=3077926 RepID=UPI0035C92B09
MLTWFDLTILTIITASSLLGLYGGLIKLIIGTLGFICSIIITYFFSPYLTKVITKYLGDSITLEIVSGIISYIISLIICSLVTSKFITIVSVIRGGMIDRTLGLTAGFLRGTIIGLLLFKTVVILFADSSFKTKSLTDILQNATIDKYPNWLQNSATTPYFHTISKNLMDILPLHRLELIKLPYHSKKADSKNVPKKPHFPKNSTPKNMHIMKELNQVLDEMLIDRKDNKD